VGQAPRDDSGNVEESGWLATKWRENKKEVG